MEKISISKIKPNPKNPRFIRDDKFRKLVESVTSFPEMSAVRPVVVNKQMVILGGNMRYRAMKEAGYTEIDVTVVDWPKEKQDEFVIKDNVSGGEWDWDLLANEWDAEDLDDWGLDFPKGYEEDVEIEEDEAPEVSQEPPASKLGAVYQLGKHRLMCGSSTEGSAIDTLMNGVVADMVFTDPPYNVDYGATMKDKLRGGTRQILNDKFETREGFYQFLYDAIASFKPYVKGSVYIAMSSSELDTLQKAFRDNDGHWSTFIIWVKNTFTMGRADYQRQYEPILYGWFEKSSHYWSGARNLGDVIKAEEVTGLDGKVLLTAENMSLDVWEFPKPTKSKEHPTMKPIALVARGIRHSSQPKQIVLDTFGGSGTTLIACEQLNRVCYMMELDPKYADVIRKRYWKFTHDNDEAGWEEGTPEIKL